MISLLMFWLQNFVKLLGLLKVASTSSKSSVRLGLLVKRRNQPSAVIFNSSAIHRLYMIYYIFVVYIISLFEHLSHFIAHSVWIILFL